MNAITHIAERKLFEVSLSAAVRNAKKDPTKGYADIVDAIETILGDGWKPGAYTALRAALGNDGKWTAYINDLLARSDPVYLKGLMLSLGFEGGFSGFRRTRESAKQYGIQIPWIILFDPTSSCNLHCEGCWASEYDRSKNLTPEDMDSLVRQGKKLGIHEYVMTGGEPLCRKDDILRLARNHSDCGFMIFTNGTLVDQKLCEDLLDCKNILLVLSIEGFREETDARRGRGVFDRVVRAMDQMRDNGLVFGTSICYTRKNAGIVAGDEFLDFLIEKGVAFSWYFHYMPVGTDASADLIPTPQQREYLYHRIREVRGFEGGKPIFLMDFQNDGEFVDGCIAGGKHYCHINANGDVEPCVFIHYSEANIHDTSLLDCLQQPLFKAYQAEQPFNSNMLRPCPMLENPDRLRALIEKTGAESTDMLSPESSEHLCSKCDAFAREWAPTAEKLWAAGHPAGSAPGPD